MLTIKFKLPDTKLAVVVWNRAGQTNETLIPTPPNHRILAETMLQHGFGVSELRAVKGVHANELIGSRV